MDLEIGIHQDETLGSSNQPIGGGVENGGVETVVEPQPYSNPWRVTNTTARSVFSETGAVISSKASITLMVISRALIAINAELLVNSIHHMAKDGPINEAFIRLIILPVASNAAEHMTGMSVAAKNNMDLAIGVSVGSSIQMGLFITSFVVVVGWVLGKEMTLQFSDFETVTLMATVLVVGFLVLKWKEQLYERGVAVAASFLFPDSEHEVTGL
ncbi:calcium/proton exchanger [Helicocarpus griseus UAMH5409]|uniref:Calcium/proton exchanger n=1 Tax=Helicocarpus griseus UAMH5409 TaxID=1447875 RepID=A0A2B7XW19_9EURO|nr:calcium/proton exchanger [Helicocarpus griseus UAMH5409]